MKAKIMNKMRNKKGFTLIELIVVIAIIAVLLGLAVPRIMGYTETARVTSDDQLVSLYRNTFNILLASGKVSIPADASAVDATIEVDRSGAIKLMSGTLYDRFTSDASVTALNDGSLKTKVQDEYIAKDKNGTLPGFKSTSYPSGIVITITTGQSVTVTPKS